MANDSASAGFGALPSALHLDILSFLPLVERVRCAPVARSWAKLLSDPTFWSELRFDGAAPGSVSTETLLQLCRRAGVSLRALDVSDSACNRVEFNTFVEGLAVQGLGVGLEVLRTWKKPADARQHEDLHSFEGAVQSAALLAACPALTSAAVAVGGTLADVQAALHALPGPGPKRALVHRNYGAPTVTCSALADWASAALSASSVVEMGIRPRCFDWRAAFAGDAAVAERAAEKLAAALAAPGGGVQSLFLDVNEVGATPMLRSLCRALTAESPLTELHLVGSCVTGAGAAEIAAALAPGRSRLRTLDLAANDLSADGGGAALLASLGANVTLTKLEAGSAAFGGPEAAAALAASLRSNATLRSLDIASTFRFVGLGPVLSALGGSAESPSVCALLSLNLTWATLDLPACQALGASLAAGARLEELNAENCSVTPEGAAAIADGLTAAAANGTARLRSLRLANNSIGREGVALARGLEAAGAASRLCRLDLAQNPWWRYAAAEAFGRVLAAAQGPSAPLRHLVLADTLMGPEGATRLAEGLQANSSLETLDLSLNGIGPEAAVTVAAAISGAGGVESGLKALYLDRNDITSVGLGGMLEAGLERNASLTQLSMKHNKLGPEGCRALAHWAVGQLGRIAAGGESLEECRQQRLGRSSGSRPLQLTVSVQNNCSGSAAEEESALAREIELIVQRANAAEAAAAAAAAAAASAAAPPAGWAAPPRRRQGELSFHIDRY